jgi:DNA-binding GntR family transcriptional regulator
VDELRGRIRRGEIAPGEPLIVLDLAAALSFSATPVREALAYLAGEGLIDGRREKLRGYATWSLSPADLADLYRLHASLTLQMVGEAARRGVDLALRAEIGRALEGASDPAAVACAAELLFHRIAAAGGGVQGRRIIRTLADRLHLVRLHEPTVLGDAAQEVRALAALDTGGVLLAQAVRTYHRRRIADVERLVAAAGFYAA